MPSLVYGIGSGLISALGSKGTWREKLPLVLKTIDNDILLSNIDAGAEVIRIVHGVVGTDRLMFDSGGFTLYKKEGKLSKEDHLKECERIKRKLLRNIQVVPFKCIFELDSEVYRLDDDLMSMKNYLRQEIFDITGKHAVPVFKPHQGFAYWKKLCESDRYELLGIGGLAQTRSWHTMVTELKIMIDYARKCGKKVHALGCSNVETCKTILPDSIDYSIFQLAISIAQARKEHPELDSYAELAPHAALWSLGRAKSRSYLYERLTDDGQDSNSNK